jgi:pyruvate, water dikinase
LNIVWLGEPAASDPALTGGKVANLSRLASTYPVPPGFCLTTEAFARARSGGSSSPAALPGWLLEELESAYSALSELCGEPAPAVAVRSSAVGEDSMNAAFAGQHHTYLNVAGLEGVARAVLDCWASAYSAAAGHYRQHVGLSTREIAVATLVQQLVRADVSGVLFSANPVTGDQGELMVNASWGLGESIVGGTVTPDTFVVRKSDGSVTMRSISCKERMTVRRPGGTEEVDVPPNLRERPSLDGGQLAEVTRIGTSLEAAMGWPVDLEFAYAGERFYLLQCRPITTLR